jgi:hypothetical protein
MTSQFKPTGSPPPTRSQRRRKGWTIRITPAGVLLLVVINLIILGGLTYGISQLMSWYLSPSVPNIDNTLDTPTEVINTSFPTEETATSEPTTSPTAILTDTSAPNPITASPQPLSPLTLNQDLIILALDEGGNTHLFAYQPEEAGTGQPLPLTRLTSWTLG